MSSTEVLEGSAAGSGAGGVAGSVAASGAGAGLGARLEAATSVLAVLVAELEPGCLSGADAKGLYGAFVLAERLCVAGKTLLAPRIDASGIWRDDGHRNAASLLASVEGISPGQARSTLELGHHLDALPDTEEAIRAGRLSRPKATEVVGAALLDPESEAQLLDGAEDQPLHEVKERCQRARAAAVRNDPISATKRIYAARSFASWSDAEGAFCYQGRDTADRGAQILNHISFVAKGLRRQRKADKAGADTAGCDEPERALRADAFFAIVTRAGTRNGTGSSPGVPGGPAVDPDIDPDVGLEDVDPGAIDGSGIDGSEEDAFPDSFSLIDRPPPCSVMVRVDLAALLRGETHPGELCELDGQGPIPPLMARDMANDSFLRFIFHRSEDIRAISHFGRTINKSLRTALVHRDRTCVVPGCGVSFGLEIDHILPMAEGGPTTIDNLALLCHHHHFLKTFEGWVLTKADHHDAHHPAWQFEPLPPFGQEPDLGADGSGGSRQLFEPG